MTRIGVISDTHGLLRPEAMACLKGSTLIVHAGDIGSADVVAGLQTLCPVRAIRGNVDRGAWAKALPQRAVVETAGRRIYVIHNLADLDFDPAGARFDVVISGHSHKPGVYRENDVLYLNPGSAGPRRFRLPVAVAVLDLSNGSACAEIHRLDHV
jgi:putative phosphoesterase